MTPEDSLYDKDEAAYVKGHENCSLEAYTDTEGYPTIGWGHLMIKVFYKTITQIQAEEFFDRDMCEAKFFISHLLPEYHGYSPARRKALIDMAFQLRGHLTHFVNAMGHLKEGAWTPAACDFMDSVWCRKQTPSRAIDNIILLIKG